MSIIVISAVIIFMQLCLLQITTFILPDVPLQHSVNPKI